MAMNDMGSEMVRAGTSQGDGLGGEIVRSGETSAAAVAAKAQALVQARYVMAMKNPRDMDVVRVNLLKACKRTAFAEKAIWSKPQGGKTIEGPSIRFAEEALRAVRNVDVDTTTSFEDDEKRIVQVCVTDLEANLTYKTDVSIEKTVERSNAKGRTVLSKRKNSSGYDTYIVVATEDEMVGKTASIVSKMLRTNGLRVVPSDIVEEALTLCRRTMADETKRDPDAARKKLVDAFAEMGVKPDALKTYLGHDVGSCSPTEIEELRGVYTAVKEGTSWKDMLDAKTGVVAEEKKPTEAGSVRERVKAKAEAARTVVEMPTDPPSEKRAREPGEEG